MTTPTSDWPKPWMLSLHEAAVKNGFVWVEGISEADYKSLRLRLYRMRRRSDSSMAAFIPPEYHLVMVGAWSADNGGRFPLIYNKKADGSTLPTVRAADGDEIEAFTRRPELSAPTAPPPLDLSPENVKIAEEEIDDIVSRMRRSAEERRKRHDS